jgi:hypothetical protein
MQEYGPKGPRAFRSTKLKFRSYDVRQLAKKVLYVSRLSQRVPREKPSEFGHNVGVE